MTRRENFRKRGRSTRGHHIRSANTPKENVCVLKPEPMLETNVGITQFISTLHGFSAVIKARYSDFHVNEIDLRGEIAKLTNTRLPPEFEIVKVPIPDESPLTEVSNDQWKQIVAIADSKDDSQCVRIDGVDAKDVRTNVHHTLKKYFQNRIVSNMEELDGKKFIVIQRPTSTSRKSKINEWPKNVPEYTHFLLYKESMDTMNAIMAISNAIHVSSASFNYAGVKDRRAKTTQWISTRRVEPAKLLFQTRRIRNVKIGNITFKDEPLKLGQLKGNQFRIALRNVQVDDDTIKERMDFVKEHGFINYYGLQRFGNDKLIPTFEIGVKLLQGNFREACNLILKPRNYDNPLEEITQAKKIYHETQNAEAAAKTLSSESSIEAKLIKGLAKSGKNDFVNALESIPRNMRLMYIHSFQSLVWNQAVSKRIQDFGFKPIVGDLVFAEDFEAETGAETKKCEVLKSTSRISSSDGNDKEETSENTAENESNEGETDQRGNQRNVYVLTEEDLDKMSIFDVVMPLPGHNVTYPGNSLKDYYQNLLKNYNLQLEMPQQKVKCYTLSGNYRKIIQKPKDLSWYTLRYKDAKDTLIRSDFEEILQHKEPEDNPEGEYKALVVQFNLASSSYATMLLREILKMDTSSQTQSNLNNYQTNEQQADSNAITDTESASLLNNKDKFEAFKKLLDGDEGEESEMQQSAECSSPKKARLEDDSSEEGIKTQASLV